MDLILTLIAESVKRYLLPGSLPLLLISLTVALGWWYLQERRRGLIRAGLTAIVLLYWLLATPGVAGVLSAGLAAPYQPLQEERPADAIIVLGGGASAYRAEAGRLDVLSQASALRALEGARLYELLGPEWVIVSGGLGRDPEIPESEPLREALIDLGVPPDRILMESVSSDTHEQAVHLATIVGERGLGDLVLVTSPSHMRRALLSFEEAGLTAVPSPAAAESMDPSRPGLPFWLPSIEGLSDSLTASREYLALAYYWVRGWI